MAAPPAAPDPGPSGPGWVIQLVGYHYHNEDNYHRTAEFVRETFIKNLQTKTVKLVDASGKESELSIKELGIGYPVILNDEIVTIDKTTERDQDGNEIPLNRWDFTIQFAWSPTPASKRLELKEQENQGQPAGGLAVGGGGQ